MNRHKIIFAFVGYLLITLFGILVIGCQPAPDPTKTSKTPQTPVTQPQRIYNINYRVTRFDLSRNVKMISQHTTPNLGVHTRINENQTEWLIKKETQPLANKPNAVDYTCTFTCIKGTAPDASVSVSLEIKDWHPDNYVLMPAAAYNGNRFEWRRIRYSPKLMDPRDIGKDAPIILTDVPRLNHKPGPSAIYARSGDMAVPAIGYYDAKAKKCVWLLTYQQNNLGDLGISIEESTDRHKAWINITAPVVREGFIYKITDSQVASPDTGHTFKQGEQTAIKFRTYIYDAPKLQTLFDTYHQIKNDLHPETPQSLPNVLPMSAAFEVQQKKFNTDNFVPKWGYYAVGMREMFLQDWQIGWTGGMISTYPLLHEGTQQTRNNVIRNFDWLFPNGISPSGFFWDSGEDGDKWYGGDIRKPHTKNWHLVRKSGDGLYYVIKQFMLMKKMNLPIKAQWQAGTKQVADAFVKLWNENQQLGQFVHNRTGQIVVGGSTSGAIVPGALALAAQWYNNPNYLLAARQIAQYYYDEWVMRGLTNGGPGDAMQNFDSESAYALVESFVELYETTGEDIYLKYAKDATAQFSTWVMPYDFEFPEGVLFEQLNIKTTGAVFANTQNKHGAPAICTHSGAGLLKLYRATNDTLALDLIHDIGHNSFQYLNHPKRPVGDLPVGWISERVNTTDWNEGIGKVARHTTWAETALMLGYIELPGLYINPDLNRIVNFDHVEATLGQTKADSVALTITNPTEINANVKILSENANDRAKPLGHNYLYNCPIAHVPAKGQTTIWVKK